MLTDDQLARIMPAANAQRRRYWLPGLNAALAEADCTTARRAAALLATVAVESGQLRWSEEIWGPTPVQRRYEGRRDLGNTQTGDGYRYRGRGLIQITGRYNYRRASADLNLPLEQNPDLAAEPVPAGRILAWYWRTRGCNRPADRGDIAAVTRIVNGGSNGLAERDKVYRRALEVLGADWTLAPAVTIHLPNGTTLPGQLVEGATFAPIRALAEALGGTVGWSETDQSATVNGHALAGRTLNGVAWAPIRAIATAVGHTVDAPTATDVYVRAAR